MNPPESPTSPLCIDAGERAVLVPGTTRWQPTSDCGVERMILDPGGEPLGKTTGFLRLAAGARIDGRERAGGAEILVLAGELCDERGRHRAGTYLRYAPGACHPQHSVSGCTLFVKLRQFSPGDLASQMVDTRRMRWLRGRSEQASVLPLHDFGGERTCLVHWRGHTGGAPVRYPRGAETLVLAGQFADEHGHYSPGSWLRLPGGCWHRPRAGRRGVLAWVKTGHLAASALVAGPERQAAEAAA